MVQGGSEQVEGAERSHKLYVGNIPYQTTEESLIELFSSCGQVLAVRIVRDRQSGRSKGFAFVEMDHEKACRQAIATYHDQPFGGRPMIVAEANADGRSHR